MAPACAAVLEQRATATRCAQLAAAGGNAPTSAPKPSWCRRPKLWVPPPTPPCTCVRMGVRRVTRPAGSTAAAPGQQRHVSACRRPPRRTGTCPAATPTCRRRTTPPASSRTRRTWWRSTACTGGSGGGNPPLRWGRWGRRRGGGAVAGEGGGRAMVLVVGHGWVLHGYRRAHGCGCCAKAAHPSMQQDHRHAQACSRITGTPKHAAASRAHRPSCPAPPTIRARRRRRRRSSSSIPMATPSS
jgi:hypothetical protein